MPNMRTGNTQPTGAQQLAALKAKQQQLLGTIKAAQQPVELPKHVEHGTLNGYNNYRCRCWDCKAVAREYQANRRRAAGVPKRATTKTHGKLSTYTHGCRCSSCKKASREYRSQQKPNDAHGTPANYNKGCRCEVCTLAAKTYRAEWRARRMQEEKHGTKYTYEKLGCRCEACTVAAGAQYKRTPIEKATGYMPEKMHGTHSGYKEYGCRCEACTRARADAMRVYRKKKTDGPTPDGVHGTLNGYKTYGCRCDSCRSVNSRYKADLRKRKLAELDTKSKSEDD